MFTPLKKPCVRHGEFVNKNCTHILFLLRMGFQPFRQALLVVLAVVFVLVVLVVLVLLVVGVDVGVDVGVGVVACWGQISCV